MAAEHTCPGCRERRIPDRLLACYVCWTDLPPEVKSDVRATYHLPLLNHDRRRAVVRAFDYWRGKTSEQRQLS